ncbi:hypothetical protein EST38_g6892 [Candolleomyces aberdarensis]|uniref:GH16 domain-containing protein n=1 Tax=Candolleomyces aberdarensis TaxID=2316362 RepID=A0A4Q2DJW0_9AGAR|nr:hypothetical protein EST38_g6892 [Candolleomyces aberdarensis]
MFSWQLIVTIIVYLHLPTSLHGYELVEDFSGATFFDKWDFYGHWDNLTLGKCSHSLSLVGGLRLYRTDPSEQRLAYTNERGNAIIKVDNTSNVPWNEKRNTVRLTSQRAYDFGTIWIANIMHLPFGCSVWPALWTMGTDWPHDGEIDMPSGCTVFESKLFSFGANFGASGGGIWAVQFDVAGIWYWARGMIPPSVLNSDSTSSIPYIGDWGNPSASFLSTESCNITEFFGPQRLVLDITLCGTWASLPELYLPQCASSGPAGYLDNVVGPGERYNDAYFEIPYIRTYTTQAGMAPTVPTPTPTPSGVAASDLDPSAAQAGEPVAGPGLRDVVGPAAAGLR